MSAATELDQSNPQVLKQPRIEFRRTPPVELPPEVLAINQQRIDILNGLQGQPDGVLGNEAILFTDIKGRRRFATRDIPQELRNQGVASVSIAYSNTPFKEASLYGISASSEIRLAGSLPDEGVGKAENTYYFPDTLNPNGRWKQTFLIRRFQLPHLRYNRQTGAVYEFYHEFYDKISYSEAGDYEPDLDTLGMAVNTLYEKTSLLPPLSSHMPRDPIAKRLVENGMIYARKAQPITPGAFFSKAT